jgi:dihydrofolate synthase/folylpolyglutamate synthase
MKYNEAVEWLYNIRRFGSKLGLKYIRHLLSLIENPQDRLRSIHVTGTNGKGSTTAMVTSILGAEGYKVGMFTSPHLSSFTERIVIDGEQIPIEEVIRLIDKLRPLAEQMGGDPHLRHPTFFEVVTAIAFSYFAENEVDFAVIETGMGGKLDATNVIQSLVSVITNVSLEHTDVLGKTVEEIAEKKAGVIKEGGVLITATENDAVYNILKEISNRKKSKIFRVSNDISFRRVNSTLKGQNFEVDGIFNSYNDLFVSLIGEHQLINAASAIGAVEALNFHGINVSKEAIKEGFRLTRWPGRLEIVKKNPMVVLDCAKDVEAIKALKKSLSTDFSHDRIIAVISISSDKNIPDMIEQLEPVVDQFVITSHQVMGRAAKPHQIAKIVEQYSKPYDIVNDVKDAVRSAIEQAAEDDLIIVAGSLFLVGEAREIWFMSTDMIEESTK